MSVSGVRPLCCRPPLFDAVCNSLTTLAAGGFSPHPLSIADIRTQPLNGSLLCSCLLQAPTLLCNIGRYSAAIFGPSFSTKVILLGLMFVGGCARSAEAVRRLFATYCLPNQLCRR